MAFSLLGAARHSSRAAAPVERAKPPGSNASPIRYRTC
jgi:hypothetical protein